MQQTRRWILVGVAALVLAGCGSSSPFLPLPTFYSGSLTGAKEVPPNGSAATGTVSAFHSSSNDLMDVTITVTGIAVADVTGFHIHLGAAGVNGPILVNLSGLGLSFQDIGAGQIRAQGNGLAFPDVNEADLLAGNCYVNVHTAAFPGGEIRSQLNLGP